MAGAIGIFCIGLLDDLAHLSPKTKLFGEFFFAGIVVWYADFSFTSVQVLGLGIFDFPSWVGFSLACLWIVGLANAINLIDGLDGLASGVTLAGLFAICVVSYLNNSLCATWLTTLLIGCLLGFLVYNSRPASIFLGDCGSLTLGYLAGCLSLLASFRENQILEGIFPVLSFAIPILDSIFAISRRTMRGRSPFSPDMEHFHHRLMAKGMSHGKAVLALWGAALICSFVAIAAAFGKGDLLFAIFVFFGFGGFILLRYLGYFRFEFFGEGLTSLMENRKTTKSAEHAIKEAEQIVLNGGKIEILESCLAKAAEGMQFQKAKIMLYQTDGKLGTDIKNKNFSIGKVISWHDQKRVGYFPKEKEFITEFTISGRNFTYGKIEYTFMDGRSSLSVQDEVLLERIHDSISTFSSKIRKENKENNFI